jgi:hypothetical protein
MFHTRRYARFSAAAVAKLKSAHAKRLVLTKTRCQTVAWAAVAGMLSYKLSTERESDNVKPVVHSSVHRCMMAAFSHGGAALRIADYEHTAVAIQ